MVISPTPIRRKRRRRCRCAAGAEAAPTADLFNQWIAQAREILKKESPANALTLRGFASYPQLPRFPKRTACARVRGRVSHVQGRGGAWSAWISSTSKAEAGR